VSCSRERLRVALCLLALAGCGPNVGAEASSTAAATGAATGVATDDAATTTAPTTGALDGGASGEGSTTLGTNMDLPPASCDSYQQDCPPGMKCGIYSYFGGGLWDDSKCVPLLEDPDKVGEACVTFNGEYSGEDSCEKGAVCFQGRCSPQCVGTVREPMCTVPHSVCYVVAEWAALCRSPCFPLWPDYCGPDSVCDLDPGDPGGFACAPDMPGGELFAACTGAPGTCDAGLTCRPPKSAVECDPMDPGCCLPFCVTDSDVFPCPGEGQECQALYMTLEEAPPELWETGVCALPT